MKNLLAIFLMAILFASCEGPMGPPGRDGLDGENSEPTSLVIDYQIEVRSSDWKLSKTEAGEPIYTYDFRIKDKDFDLYKKAYYEGLVTSYMYLDFGDKDLEAQTPLPNPVNRQDNEGHLWTETYSYDYTVDGFIIFKVSVSDFFLDQKPPTTYFRVALTY